MKKVFSLAGCFCLCLTVFCQQQNISIIPEPVQLVKKTGVYLLPKDIVISIANNTAIQFAADYLQKKISTATGYSVKVLDNSTAASNTALICIS